jgi:hypothetical protein
MVLPDVRFHLTLPHELNTTAICIAQKIVRAHE